MSQPNVLGVDVERLEQFARILNDTAQAFNERAAQLTNELASVQWSGNYANRFRDQWNSQARQQLATIVQMLQEAGQQSFNHAQQQRAVSGN